MALIEPNFQYLSRHADVDLTNCDREAIHLVGKIQQNSWTLVLSADKAAEQGWHPLAVSENITEISGRSVQEFLELSLSELLPNRVLGAVKSLTQANLPEPDHLDHVSFPWGAEQVFDLSLHIAGEHLIIEWMREADVTPRLVFPFLEGASEITDSQQLKDFTTELVRRVVGCDQVILYRFDDGYHGQAIAESKEEHLPSYLHHWFPESDVPVPARIVMVKRPVGVTMDNHTDGVSLVSNTSDLPDIDMSRCEFRLPSRMCSQFYKNMGVQGRMAVSIVHRSRLWGFFACWDYRNRMMPSLRLRRELESLSQYFIEGLTKLKSRTNLSVIRSLKSKHESILQNMTEAGDMAGAIANIDGLCSSLPSDGAALVFPEHVSTSGNTPPDSFISDLARWLDKNHASSLVYSHRNLSSVYAPASEHKERCSGILALRLGRKKPNYLIWFRKEILLEIPWAGKPEKPIDPHNPDERLLPRTSFSLWREQAVGFSAPWLDHEIDLATEFRDELLIVLYELANIELTTLLERAREAEAARKSLLANVSHDLRTPVNGIIANAEMLTSELETSEHKEMAADILSSSRILIRLLNDLLDQAKLNAGAMTINRVATHLPDLSKGLMNMLKPMASEKRVELVFDWGNTEGKRLYLDSDRVSQICMNLLSNAIKFTNERTVIRLKAKLDEAERGAKLEISVTDSGRGIPEEKRDAIFDAFQQVRSDDHKVGNGAGLGLSIVWGLVSLMEGTVAIDDNPEGGTVFTVQIPIAKVLKHSAEAEKAAQAFQSDTGDLTGFRLLIAEDNLVNLRIKQAFVKRANCQATIVENGKKALEAAQKEKFDLLVFDISMPEMDGDEVVRHIRNSDNINRSTPAMAVTAHVDKDQVDDILASGFNGHIGKPVAYGEFLRMAKELIGH